MSRYNHNRYQSSNRQSSDRTYSPARYQSQEASQPESHTIPARPAEKSVANKQAKPKQPPVRPSKRPDTKPPGKLIQDAFPVKQSKSGQTSESAKPAPKRSSVLHRSSVEKPYGPSKAFGNNIEKLPKERNSPLVRWRFIGVSLAVLVIVGGIGSLAAILFHSMPSGSSDEVLSEQTARTSGMQTEQSAYVSEDPVSEREKENHQVADNEPKRVHVDHIDIDARIYRAGVNRHNQLIMPDNVHDVNWYEGSRAPGNRGAVLLSGYVSGPTERGALYYTRALEHGDIITVENGDGTTHDYEVVQREFVPYDEVDLYSMLVPYERGKNTLHILAADDRYNVMNNGFQDRLVIYAVEVE